MTVVFVWPKYAGTDASKLWLEESVQRGMGLENSSRDRMKTNKEDDPNVSDLQDIKR